MKKISASTVSSVLLKTFLVFGLSIAAAISGVAVAAFFALHELGVSFDIAKPNPLARAQAEMSASHGAIATQVPSVRQERKVNLDGVERSPIENRFVSSDPLDKPEFTYADYHINLAKIPAAAFVKGRVSTIVPPALDMPAQEAAPVEVAPAVGDGQQIRRYLIPAVITLSTRTPGEWSELTVRLGRRRKRLGKPCCGHSRLSLLVRSKCFQHFR